jgi:C-terminal binding-module, SLH-like, of glucodextranase
MLTLALAVLLTFTDPPADLGNGQVHQPTAAVGRPNGALDVTQLELYDTQVVTFSLTFTSLGNPFKLANSFTFPIIELYIDDQSGTGSTTLLPGSGMRLPKGATWKHAFKLTGDTLQVFEATANGWQDVTSKYPANISVQGTTIVVSSSLPRPERVDLYGVVGSYTGFNESGWAPLSTSESPWAYSSDTQTFPVLDVLAPTFEAQQNALTSGVLPVIRPPRPTNPWLFVMIGGVLIALAGVLLRFAPNRNHTPPNREPLPAYTPAPAVSPVKTAQDNKPKRAYPGPYKAEPLKSRSSVLKNLAEDTPVKAPENQLTPGQLMAAERVKSIIVNDRKDRDAGETLVESQITEPVHRAKVALETVSETEQEANAEPAIDQISPDEVGMDEVGMDEVNINEDIRAVSQTDKPDASDSNIVSSAAIPLFQAPPRLTANPLPTAPPLSKTTPATPITSPAKAQFAASPLEWHGDEDEFDFLWPDKEKTSADAKPALKNLTGLEPKKQNPENS